MFLWVDSIIILVSLVFLLYSADLFIDNAAALAKHIGMSALMVGVVIVGFGTSAPEIMVSIFSALEHQSGIALGNAYGSNIANIGLVLGVTALFYPVFISREVITKEIPLLLAVIIICGLFLFDLHLSRLEGLVMIVMITGIMIIKMFWDKNTTQIINDEPTQTISRSKLIKIVTLMLVGLLVLLVSSKFVVDSAVNIANALGVSDLIIGLTIVAVGTSLPELAASITAAKKQSSDIVLGNIIGSCLFNALAVVGIASAIYPMEINQQFLLRDFLLSLGLILLLWFLIYKVRDSQYLKNKAGLALFTVYIAYTIYLITTAT